MAFIYSIFKLRTSVYVTLLNDLKCAERVNFLLTNRL
jgi:hypothetical protein